jgi:hypothetical protein
MVAVQSLKGEIIQLILSQKGGGNIILVLEKKIFTIGFKIKQIKLEL